MRGKQVDLEPIGQESYDRLVAMVYVGDTNANERLLKDGEAWAARKYLRKKHDAEWCAYENAARQTGSGLWEPPTKDWIYKDYAQETSAKCIAQRPKTFLTSLVQVLTIAKQLRERMSF